MIQGIKHEFGTRARGLLAGNEHLIAAIGNRYSKCLLDTHKVFAVLAVKFRQEAVIVKFDGHRFVDRRTDLPEVFVRLCQSKHLS